MPKIKVIQNFRFAEQGLHVTEYQAGDIVDVSDDCAEVAIAEKWATADKPRRATAKAPENTATEQAPEVK